MTSLDPMALADELKRIRRDARISSQQELANLAGVNRSTIKNIEMGRGRPKVDTLILIARGAATDPSGVVDQDRRDRYFDRLMRAAGYQADSPQGAGTEARQMTWAEARQWLIGVTGRRDVSFAFADVFSNYKSLGPAHQQALEAAAMAAVEALRMKEEAERERRERQSHRDD
jgi:transcriptional regulator with XRE-family HTH domain